MAPIIKNAASNAGATALYVIAVASFLFYAPKIFGEHEPKTVLVPIVMLLLFVFSAAVTGSLVFGRSVLWYLDGKKKEGLQLLGWTFAILFYITAVAAVALFLSR